LCNVETVRPSTAKIVEFVFDETSQLVTIASGAGTTEEIRRGASTPGATDTFLFARAAQNDTAHVFRGGTLFVQTGSRGVARWPSGTMTMIDANGENPVLDATHIYYSDGPGAAVYRVDHAGAGKTRVDVNTPGKKSALAEDASNVYAVATSPPYVYKIPKSGVGGTQLPVTGMPVLYAAQLFATATRLVGSSYRYTNPVTCQSTTIARWSLPLAGGAVTMLTSGTGFLGPTAMAGSHVYWVEGPCTGVSGPWRILRRHEDGSDGPLLIAETSEKIVQMRVEGAHAYWLVPSGIYRTAR
jgi:hypothetical protein